MVDCVGKLNVKEFLLGSISVFETIGECYFDEKSLDRLLNTTLSNYGYPFENHFKITVREDGEEILW
jgi:hypothetical protein